MRDNTFSSEKKSGHCYTQERVKYHSYKELNRVVTIGKGLTSPSKRRDSVSNLGLLNQFITSSVTWITGARHNDSLKIDHAHSLYGMRQVETSGNISIMSGKWAHSVSG